MKYVKIPSAYNVGGQPMEVRMVERCDDNAMGICHVCAGYIEIADKVFKDDKQSAGSKTNSFYHELTHSILATMGEKELNDNEKFVCSFSSFLNEAMAAAVFIEEEEEEEGK